MKDNKFRGKQHVDPDMFAILFCKTWFVGKLSTYLHSTLGRDFGGSVNTGVNTCLIHTVQKATKITHWRVLVMFELTESTNGRAATHLKRSLLWVAFDICSYTLSSSPLAHIVLKSLHTCKMIWSDSWERNVFVWMLTLTSHGVYFKARSEKGKCTYTAVIHPFPSLGFVCFIILHEGLHQVLGSLGSRRLLGWWVRLWDRAFCGGRWRRLDLLYLSCNGMKKNDPF